MAPSWATPQQKAFLRSEIPAFLDAQQQPEKQEALDKFHQRIHKLWFEKWPIRVKKPKSKRTGSTTAVNKDEAREQEKKKERERKEKELQIYRWFYWNTTGKYKRQTVPAKKLITQLLTKESPRRLQASQVYHKMNKDVLRPLVNERIETRGAKSRSDRMQIRRQVVKEAWENELPNVVEAVKETYRCQPKPDSVSDDHATQTRTPHDYSEALSSLPSALQSLLGQLAEATGWVFFVSAGGPYPQANGNIYVQNYYFGPRNASGHDFKTAYPDFDKGFRRPFSTHITKCFPLDVCASRSLNPNPSGSTLIGLDSNLASTPSIPSASLSRIGEQDCLFTLIGSGTDDSQGQDERGTNDLHALVNDEQDRRDGEDWLVDDAQRNEDDSDLADDGGITSSDDGGITSSDDDEDMFSEEEEASSGIEGASSDNERIRSASRPSVGVCRPERDGRSNVIPANTLPQPPATPISGSSRTSTHNSPLSMRSPTNSSLPFGVDPADIDYALPDAVVTTPLASRRYSKPTRASPTERLRKASTRFSAVKSRKDQGVTRKFDRLDVPQSGPSRTLSRHRRCPSLTPGTPTRGGEAQTGDTKASGGRGKRIKVRRLNDNGEPAYIIHTPSSRGRKLNNL